MILIIDNYDSFTYNIYQYVAEFESDIKIYRNDEITIEEIEKLNPDKIIISSGPKTPEDTGISVDVVKKFYNKIPILGISLGHKVIGYAFNSKIIQMDEISHGKASMITHTGEGIFKGIESPTQVARYHSLIIDSNNLSKEFDVIAKTENGDIMGIKHKNYCLIGLQFNPESIYTPFGMKIIENFIKM